MQSKKENDNITINSVGTLDVVSVPQTMKILSAIETLTKSGFRRLPIVDPGTLRLKGLITARDVVNFLGGGELFKLINVKHSGNFLAAINESVSKLMSHEVITLPPDAPLIDAIEIIIKERIGGIPMVNEEGILCGIITERDVMKVLCKSMSDTKVSDVMTKSLLVVTPEAPVSQVTKVMISNKFRRLPIVKDDVLFGIITATDIVRYVGTGQVFDKIVTGNVTEAIDVPVRSLITGKLFTILPDATITDVARMMISKNVGALPVIEDNKLLGLITEFDLVRYLVNQMTEKR